MSQTGSGSALCFFAVPKRQDRKSMPVGYAGYNGATTQTFPVIILTEIASLPTVAFIFNPPEQLKPRCGSSGKRKNPVVPHRIKSIHYSSKISTYGKPDVTMSIYLEPEHKGP